MQCHRLCILNGTVPEADPEGGGGGRWGLNPIHPHPILTFIPSQDYNELWFWHSLYDHE